MKCWTFIVLLIAMPLTAQIERVEPPNWWLGFEDSSLQLMLYGKGLQGSEVEIDHPGIKLVKVNNFSITT